MRYANGVTSWQNRVVTFYPGPVNNRFLAPVNIAAGSAGAAGRSASFVCGSFVELFVSIDGDRNVITGAKFRTNGCGFLIATADVLCEWLAGKMLGELHGLNDDELNAVIEIELGEFPSERVQCAGVVFDALRNAMSRHRESVIHEFQGETALICTCFGVTEETIVEAISSRDYTSVDEVSESHRAGSGCGSCRFLIQELIDAKHRGDLG
jgi:NifU-like protein